MIGLFSKHICHDSRVADFSVRLRVGTRRPFLFRVESNSGDSNYFGLTDKVEHILCTVILPGAMTLAGIIALLSSKIFLGHRDCMRNVTGNDFIKPVTQLNMSWEKRL